MRIDESQRTQFIVLCCLVAIVLAYGAYSLIGKKGPGAKKPSESTEAQAGASQAAGATGDAFGVWVAALSDKDARDPFAVQLVAPSQSQTPPSRTEGPTPVRPDIPPVYPIIVGPNGIGPPVGPPEPAPAEQLRLTGVVEGDVNIAIIRGEGDARHIVREGQTIDGKYAVESISRLGVRLRSYEDNQIIVLRLGGEHAT